MTKKAAAMLLAASLAVSMCATPVFATGTTGLTHSNGGSGNGTAADVTPKATEVTYNVDCSYTWSIPTEIKFGRNAGVNRTRIVNAQQGEDQESSEPIVKITGSLEDVTPGKAPAVWVTKNVIEDGKKLKIQVDTDKSTYDDGVDQGFFVKTESSEEKLYFTIDIIPQLPPYKQTSVNENQKEILIVPAGKNKDKTELEFELKTAKTKDQDAAEKAGTYKGQVAFTASIVDN